MCSIVNNYMVVKFLLYSINKIKILWGLSPAIDLYIDLVNICDTACSEDKIIRVKTCASINYTSCFENESRCVYKYRF